MQRILGVTLFAACLLAGCNQQAPSPRDVAQPGADPKVAPAGPPVVPGGSPTPNDPSKAIDAIISGLTETNTQDQYNAALLAALAQLADKKYAEALATLETARALRDGEQIRDQIERVKGLLAHKAAADKTVQDIRAVLNDGKAEEAAKLSTAALGQFGDSDAADDLGKLKRQADALSAPADNAAARRAFCLQEAAAAVKDDNLRGAAIAYEQALQAADDANVRRDLDALRVRLTRYDDGRRRAAELRRDPATLDDAVAALRDARDAWDTPQVRAEADECQLWLQKRRDRVSVADFEVRGDVGLPFAGRAVAEEMLPAFKTKFDLVEREQLGKVLGELKLEAGAVTDNPDGRQALGRLARVRFLVVGSLTPVCGVTLNARLVDVQTGLIVQTARYSAPSMEGLLKKLPLVAQMLLLTDDQKLALEHQLGTQSIPEIRPIEFAPLPPAPVVVITEPPPPIITYTPRPPAFVGVVIEDFRRPPPPPVIEIEFRREDPRRQRLFQLSVELGDNLFKRGRYQEAQRHFELALTLTDERKDIEVRLGRCKPLLPPPPQVVVVAPVVRPRAIVFNFFVNCEPGLVPPAVGDWASDNLACYLAHSFEIVERGEVCWYMGRLGITMKDVMSDAGARRALAQALHVRFMVFSAIEQTHSLNVTTQLVDADTGARTGSGSIHVQDHDEMKLRMQELANQIAVPPEQQAKLAKQGQDNEKALNEARRLQKAGDNVKAATVAREALKQDTNNVALQQLVQDNDRLARQAATEQARKQDAERVRAEAEAVRKREAEVARQAEAARLRAEQDAKVRTDVAKREQEAKKDRAYEQLMTQGRDALKRNDYGQAVQSFQGATALKPSDDGFKELAQAKAKQDQATRTRAADEQAKRDAEAKRVRDAELARADTERKQKETADALKRQAQEDHDKAEVARLLKQAQDQLGKQQFDAARSTVQTARHIRPGPDLDNVMHQIQEQQDLAEAKKKGDQARLDAEKKQADDRKLREQADAEAKKKQDAYAAAIKHAQDATAAKKYEEAIAAYQEAGKLFKTDAVLSGQRHAEELRDHDKAQADAAKKQQEEDAKRDGQVKKLLADGQKSLDAKQYDQAVAQFREAAKLAPNNVDVLAAIGKAEHARDQFAAANRAQLEEQKKAAFNKLLDDGKTALNAKRYDDAVKSFTDAVHSQPQDATAQGLLQQAQKARSDAKQAADAAKAAQDADAKRKQDEAKKRDDYNRLIGQAQAAVNAKHYDDAIKDYNDALKVLPGDAAATKGIKDATQARDAAKAAQDEEARRKQEEAKRRDDYNRLIGLAQAAVTAKRFDDAIKDYNDALKVMPGDAAATKGVKDATVARDAAKAAADAEAKRKQDEAKKQADFNRFMDQGKAALTAKKYDEALRDYGDALKLFPSDAGALKGQKDAQQALDASKVPPPPPPPDKSAEYKKQMDSGAALEKQKKFTEALAAYREALKLMPGDAKATGAIKWAEFEVHMTEGQRLLDAKKFPDAVKEFEEASKLFPDNADAKNFLKKAKDAK